MDERDEIDQLVIANAGQSFSGSDFRMLCKPCVYMLMQDSVPIYIGMSNQGMQRIAQRQHHQAELAIKECDEVRIYPCVSIEAAYRLEAILISNTQPKHNRRRKTVVMRERLGLKRSYQMTYIK